jgi:hypothetical protein
MEMEPCNGDHSCRGSLCVAIATANQHTVCAVWYGEDRYGLFDSAPGEFTVGLSGQEMVEKLRTTLGIRASSHSGPGKAKRSRGNSDDDGPSGKKNESSVPKHSECDITLLYMRL